MSGTAQTLSKSQWQRVWKFSGQFSSGQKPKLLGRLDFHVRTTIEAAGWITYNIYNPLWPLWGITLETIGPSCETAASSQVHRSFLGLRTKKQTKPTTPTNQQPNKILNTTKLNKPSNPSCLIAPATVVLRLRKIIIAFQRLSARGLASAANKSGPLRLSNTFTPKSFNSLLQHLASKSCITCIDHVFSLKCMNWWTHRFSFAFIFIQSLSSRAIGARCQGLRFAPLPGSFPSIFFGLCKAKRTASESGSASFGGGVVAAFKSLFTHKQHSDSGTVEPLANPSWLFIVPPLG